MPVARKQAAAAVVLALFLGLATALVFGGDDVAQSQTTSTDNRDVAPELGEVFVVARVSGTVRGRPPGSRRFVTINRAREIGDGWELDVAKGVVRLTTAVDRHGRTQSARFSSGRFRVRQSKAVNGLSTLSLSGGNVSCASATAAQRRSKRVLRRLFGSGKGRFRTKGRFAAATVRGTRWDTIDRCDGTLIRVREGSVTVRDTVRNRTRIVRAPRSLLIPRG